VPGHEGVEGNEIADALAKEGTKIAVENPLFNYVSFSYIRRQARAAAFEKWNELWEQRRSGKRYRGHPKRKLEPVLKNLPKRDTARITHLRTGHGYFKDYLARIPTSNVDSPRCSCGNHRHTPEHLLLFCANLKHQRKTMRKQLSGLPFNLDTILYTSKGLEATIQFMRKSRDVPRPEFRPPRGQGLGRLTPLEDDQ